MKELSIEEKARRYDEAINKAKSKINNDKDHVLYEDDIIEIFPELKESEDERDERIRKALIKGFNECLISSSHYPENAVKYWHGIVIDDIFVWLEKQGEQKSTDKVEPKFKVGDWITIK